MRLSPLLASAAVMAAKTAALRVDPEWAPIWDRIGSAPKPNFTNVLEVRKAGDATVGLIMDGLPRHDGMLQSKHQVTSLDGTVIDVYRFLPKALQDRGGVNETANADLGRAVVMNFGGGYIAGSAASWAPAMADLAERAGTQVFAPEYRIAPEHPAPAGVEDAFATVAWLQQPASAAAFGVDPARIVLGGMSAGGGIAVNAALMARDRGGLKPPVAALLLRYPMLDDRTRLPAGDPLHGYLIWTQRENDLAWEAYLAGGGRYGAAARAEDVAGLPDTYVGVGSLDLFKAEDADYAARLAKADNGVELHLYPGVAHGFDLAAPGIRLSREMYANEVRFIKKF
ncbi:hypothetical protein RB595_003568 [Gaeumannomyces hyphopodioides]